MQPIRQISKFMQAAPHFNKTDFGNACSNKKQKHLYLLYA
jgi:hypothetical protein